MWISYEHRAFCAVAFLSSALFQDGSFGACWNFLLGIVVAPII
jgi:hypothetical protein